MDLLGGLFSAASGLVDNLFAKNRQEDQQAFNAQQFASRYQTTVKDMQAAGLNPMLAYSQGGGAGASSGIAGSSGSMTQAYSAYRENQRQQEMTDAQVKLLGAQTAKAEAEAEVAKQYALPRAGAELSQVQAQTGLTSAQIAQSNSQTDKNIAELKNIPLEGERLVRAANLLYQQASESYQRQLTESQRYEMVKNQAKLYLEQAGLTHMDLKAAQSLENAGRIGKEVKPFFDMLRSLIRK